MRNNTLRGRTVNLTATGGGPYGQRHFTVAVGHSTAHHHSSTLVLALIMARAPLSAVDVEPAAPLAGTGVSALSWSAVIGGTVAAIAVTLTLLALGSAFGLATISPWPGLGAKPTSFTIGAGIWLVVTQWLSAALGGYIAGRLRVRWFLRVRWALAAEDLRRARDDDRHRGKAPKQSETSRHGRAGSGQGAHLVPLGVLRRWP